MLHSPNTLKSKWNSFKTWITPDLTKRRPSQCSTTSTTSTASITTTTHSLCCCHQPIEEGLLSQHTKRPSLTGSEGLGVMVDKCMSPFRRRPSNATPEEDIEKETEKVYDLYHFAMDELNYAEDSQGSPYYSGDRIAAKEAIEQCEQAYSNLIENYSAFIMEDHLSHLESTIGFKISTLRTKYDSLPLQQQDDNDDCYYYYY